MEIKLFDSELKVMDVLWRAGPVPARQVARELTEALGWNVNTTYTLLKRCIQKGAAERTEPGFVCRALVPREAVQAAETDALIDRVYGGHAEALFAHLLSRRKLSAEELARLRQLVENLS